MGLAAAAGFAVARLSFVPDINYKLRQLLIDSFTREITIEEKEESDGVSVMYSTCAAADVDHNNHMNNSVYIRELNFARRKHFTAVGLWGIMRFHNRNVLVSAQTIRYRREIKLGQDYIIRTKIIGYSDRNSAFWLQAQFEEPDSGFVLAVHILKYKLVSNSPPTEAVAAAGAGAGAGAPRDFPPSMLLIEVGLGGIVAAGRGDVDVPGNVPVVDACAPMNVLHKI